MIASIKSLGQVSSYDERETNNITPKPVAQSHTPKTTTRRTAIFVDWLKFFGENLWGITERHEKLLVDLFLRLDFFRTIEHQKDNLDPLFVQVIECKKATRPGSGRSWDYYYQNSLGIRLYISKNKINLLEVETLSLEFSGSSLSILIPRNNSLKLGEMIEFVQSLNKKIKVTRIDTTLEFDHRLLDFYDVFRAVNGQQFSGVQTVKSIYEIDVKDGIQYPTIYFGADGSDKRTRIYETTATHGYSAIRIECQNRQRHAVFVANELVNIYKSASDDNCIHAQKLTQFIRDYTLSRKNFNLVSSDSKKVWKVSSQYEELPFWSEFKNKMGVQNLEYFLPIKISTIQDTFDWVIKQVSGTLNVLSTAFGTEYAHELLDHFVKINQSKYDDQGGLSSENAVRVGQLRDMGFKAHVEMFSPEARYLMKDVGFYGKQTRPKYWRSSSVVDFLNLAIEPESHWEYNTF